MNVQRNDEEQLHYARTYHIMGERSIEIRDLIPGYGDDRGRYLVSIKDGRLERE